ncbi:hypothetical protein WMY93_015106 [Mugilogobius chulae]|uniref:Uncharacterized protein n=1 Tax=Mugilogobius chulae TaxID=88201 RepID=A0AAW0P940_9GOBI
MVDEENGNQSRYQMLRQAEPTKSEPNVQHDETGQFLLITEISQEKNAQDNPENGSEEVENEKREQAGVGVLDALELAFSFHGQEEGLSEGATFSGLGIEGVDVNEQTDDHRNQQKRTCDAWIHRQVKKKEESRDDGRDDGGDDGEGDGGTSLGSMPFGGPPAESLRPTREDQDPTLGTADLF